ncbi:MAG: hypothetical protein ACJAX3_000478 [Patiriisocius sp.]
MFLKLKEMKIGFGAGGKGYAADKAKTLLISKGVTSEIHQILAVSGSSGFMRKSLVDSLVFLLLIILGSSFFTTST